jgi:hypothetical protein
MASVNRGKRLRTIPIDSYKEIIKERLLSKIEIDDNCCWRWTAYKNSNGYGSFRYLGKNSLAHRISHIVHKGEIPIGIEVCHSCDVADCINPEHLFLGTHNDNMMDAKLKNRRKGRLSYTNNVLRDASGKFLKENQN